MAAELNFIREPPDMMSASEGGCPPDADIIYPGEGVIEKQT